MVQKQEELLDKLHALYREKERLKELEEQISAAISKEAELIQRLPYKK